MISSLLFLDVVEHVGYPSVGPVLLSWPKLHSKCFCVGGSVWRNPRSSAVFRPPASHLKTFGASRLTRKIDLAIFLGKVTPVQFVLQQAGTKRTFHPRAASVSNEHSKLRIPLVRVQQQTDPLAACPGSDFYGRMLALRETRRQAWRGRNALRTERCHSHPDDRTRRSTLSPKGFTAVYRCSYLEGLKPPKTPGNTDHDLRLPGFSSLRPHDSFDHC